MKRRLLDSRIFLWYITNDPWIGADTIFDAYGIVRIW